MVENKTMKRQTGYRSKTRKMNKVKAHAEKVEVLEEILKSNESGSTVAFAEKIEKLSG